jgi:pilus assembly protein CpaB
VRGSGRRRRGLTLLALALACGGLAAAQVNGRVRAVEARVGPLVPVLVAARDLPADAEIDARAVATGEVPERYVAADALAAGQLAAGQRTSVSVAAGTVLTAAHLEGGMEEGGGSRLRPGERAVDVAAAGGEALAGAAPGARVDVLVSSDRGAGGGSTFVALEDVELLALRPGAAAGAGYEAGEADPAASATATATLRVTARQAVYLTAAGSFGREVRLLVRPSGDRKRVGPAIVGAGEL